MMIKLPIIWLIILLFQSCFSDTKESEGVYGLNTDWIKITNLKGKQVIYNSCDMGNLILTTEEKEKQSILVLHSEQEDDIFTVKSQRKIGDTIFLDVQNLNSKISQSFKFNWVDKSRGIARWQTTYENGYDYDFQFVNKSNHKEFEIINQPCRECWGDDCDDFKKVNN